MPQQSSCVTFSKNVFHVLFKKHYFTGRQYWKVLRTLEIVVVLYFLCQGIVFVIQRLQNPIPQALLWYRRVYAISLFSLQLIRIFLLNKALKLIKQHKQTKKLLIFYYGLVWVQYLIMNTLGIKAYVYGYFNKSNWTLATYFYLIVFILLDIFFGIGIWNTGYHVRSRDSLLMQKLREFIQDMKHNQQTITQKLSKEPESNAVEVDIENIQNDIVIPRQLFEKHIISPLDIIINEDSIGEGQYGIVRKGVLRQNGVKHKIIMKALKNLEQPDALNMLLEEIKTIIHVGDHVNIVKFYGISSDTEVNCACGIVNEYCSNGDLNEFLLNPENFVALKSKIPSLKASAESNFQPESLQQSQMLVQFSRQICLGMEHLAAKKVIHGDLATRNVLLTENLTIKITDFGLSHRLYNYQLYSKIKDLETLLPWKWLSIEALEDLKFSEKSDVWSYGITLWEIFNLGASPYQGLTWDSNFTKLIRSGYRLPQPSCENLEMYNIMQNCWLINSEDRPSFTQIKNMFDEKLT